MRKYQQLLLVVVSLISVTILIAYKSENNRLNNVLNVVNFFGRTDSLNLVKIENVSNYSYGFDFPLPSWTNLGNNFHSYSSFWKKNDLVAGGEAISVVVGSLHASVLFQCKIQFHDNKIINGKFGFMRIESDEEPTTGTAGDKYLIYKFICRTTRDNGAPKNLIFINTETKAEQYLPIRNLQLKNKQLYMDKSLITVCLDMNPYNKSYQDNFVNDTNILQYFLYHELIGIRNFIIYNSNINQLNHYVLDLLSNKYGIRLNVLPYNFPFDMSSKTKNRAIIETDCLMRTSGLSKYVLVSALNEYFYPTQKLSPSSPLIKLFNNYSNDVNRFEISTKSVCTDSRKRILSDNTQYSVDIKSKIFYIFKNEYPYNDKLMNDISKKSIEVERNLAFIHKYTSCSNRTDLYSWRTTVEESHLSYMDFVSKELNKLLFH